MQTANARTTKRNCSRSRPDALLRRTTSDANDRIPAIPSTTMAAIDTISAPSTPSGFSISANSMPSRVPACERRRDGSDHQRDQDHPEQRPPAPRREMPVGEEQEQERERHDDRREPEPALDPGRDLEARGTGAHDVRVERVLVRGEAERQEERRRREDPADRVLGLAVRDECADRKQGERHDQNGRRAQRVGAPSHLGRQATGA